MSRDVIGDFLTIIRNGLMRSKRYVVMPHSTMKMQIAQLLLNEGFIKSVDVLEDASVKKTIKVALKYVNGESVIHDIRRVSKPGCRQYARSLQLQPVIGNLGVSILTTSQGIMTNKKAREVGIGGEVICTVW